MKKMTVQEARELGLRKPWAMLRFLSAASLGDTPADVDLEELLEGRFFDENEEIRIFFADGRQKAVCLRGNGDTLTRRFAVSGGEDETIQVSYDLDYDEDGQARVRAVRLSGWQSGKEARHG